MRKISLSALIISTVLVLGALPAAAHAVFVGAPNGVTVNAEQALTVSVPHERDDTTYNTDILIAMPPGWQALSCESKPTWTCSIGTSGDRPVVHFVKASGAQPAEDETFRFAVRAAPTVGTFSFPTVQTYNTGEVVRWIDATGGAEPAPVLQTLPGGSTPASTAPTTTVDHGPAPTVPPTAPAPTTAPTSPAPTSPAATPTTAVAPPTSTAATSTTKPAATTTASTTSTTPTLAVTTTLPAATDASGNEEDFPVGLVIATAVIVIAGTTTGVIIARRRRAMPTEGS